jgi:hypothetical protein
LEVKAYRSREVTMVDLGAPIAILSLFDPEGEGTMILRQAGNNLPNQTV